MATRRDLHKGRNWQKSFPFTFKNLNLNFKNRNELGRILSQNESLVIRIMLLSSILEPAVNTTSRFLVRKLLRENSRFRFFDPRLDHFSAYFPVFDLEGHYPLRPFYAKLPRHNRQRIADSIPLPTDNGICAVFNSPGYSALNPENDVLIEVMRSLVRPHTRFIIEAVKGFGHFYGLKFILTAPLDQDTGWAKSYYRGRHGSSNSSCSTSSSLN